MNKVAILASFVVGAAIGAATSWYFTKRAYERIAQEEIDSVKEAFSNLNKEDIPAKDEKYPDPKAVIFDEDVPGAEEYVEIIRDAGYSAEASASDVKKPYIISPDEFGEYSDYQQIELMYYTDHILADDDDEVVTDVENLVGFEFVSHFGDYEDDSVCVRNDRLKCDFMILLSYKSYEDLLKEKPYKAANKR